MGVLGSDHLHGVDGVCVTSSRQRRLKDGQVLGSHVPEENLTGVGSAKYQIRVEGGESNGEYIRLGMLSEIARARLVAVTCECSTNSGRSSMWRFQIATSPSGSFNAAGFLLYAAQLISGY